MWHIINRFIRELRPDICCKYFTELGWQWFRWWTCTASSILACVTKYKYIHSERPTLIKTVVNIMDSYLVYHDISSSIQLKKICPGEYRSFAHLRIYIWTLTFNWNIYGTPVPVQWGMMLKVTQQRSGLYLFCFLEQFVGIMLYG